MKTHNATSTPAAAACQPDAVRGAALIICVGMVCATWRVIEGRKLMHARREAAVRIAFSQDKLRLRKSTDYTDLILDLNSALKPGVIQLFFRGGEVRLYKACNLLKRLFKFSHALFKLFYFLFHRIVRVGVVEDTTMGGTGSRSNMAARHQEQSGGAA